MSGHRAGDPGSTETGATYAVDRIEGRGRPGARVVLVTDDGRELDVPIEEFGPVTPPVEGAIYRLAPRSLDWRTARRDRAEEQRRRTAADAKLKALQSRDPGGDLKL